MEQLLKARPYTAWQLIKLYWQSEKRFSIYLTTAIILCMTVVLVAFDVVFNYWYNFFYNALQNYDKSGAIRLLAIFFVLASFYIVLAVYRYYISQVFGLRWRQWLTRQFINRWLQKRGYYYLENFDEKTDNPDQRIQEDVLALVNYSLNLTIGLISAITTFFAFIYVLWQLSGVIHLHLGPLGSVHIPGYLVWVAIIYSLIGTLLVFKIGRPLISLNFEQQRREATFRFAAVDLRSHAENVALSRGEHHQKTILGYLFNEVLGNWYQIILRQKLLLWFTNGFNQTAILLPLLVVLPNYFEKVFLLGGLMQSLQAFGRIQDALAFLINAFTDIAQWRAVTQRLTTFVDHLETVEEKARAENKLQMVMHADNSIVTQNVTISTPRNQLLLANINETFKHGHHYLIKGESGLGKSTFVRALAGIWPYSSGKITFPEHQRIMYLPQKSYMPIGTLAEAVLFPDKHDPSLQNHLKSILTDCHLEHLIPRLNEIATWSQQLSPGEQQRIAFARVLLHKPDWVFLDESTSMLDLANEEHLYRLLKAKLPHCSIVSVGHRPSLVEHHHEIIEMHKYHTTLETSLG